MNIYLCKMTKPLAHQYFSGFAYDPDTFSDTRIFQEYAYNEADVNEHWEKQRRLGRIHLAIMLESIPIGEVILKEIDVEKQHCVLSIHMKNDSVKNLGFGTQAELLTLEYAFQILKMETVFADALRKNKRSQHVLEKVGFQKFSVDDRFIYYRCDRVIWCSRRSSKGSSGESKL